jgi:hypothetical protein
VLDSPALGVDSPLPERYSADLRGTLLVTTYGAHEFWFDRPTDARAYVDGQLVTEAGGRSARPVTLARGVHALRVVGTVQPGDPPSRLQWERPGDVPIDQQAKVTKEMTRVRESIGRGSIYRTGAVPANGLLGRYYPNGQWSGEPRFARVDSVVDFYFHLIPIDPRPFSVEWTGKLFVPDDGTYTLATESHPYSDLSIDGRVVVENRTSRKEQGATLTLARGYHDVRVRYSDEVGGGSSVYLYWTPPNGQRAKIPGACLFPAREEMPASPNCVIPR